MEDHELQDRNEIQYPLIDSIMKRPRIILPKDTKENIE